MTTLLVPCDACHHQVSDAALTCPTCGHPLRRPRKPFGSGFLEFVFGLFNVLMVLLAGPVILAFSLDLAAPGGASGRFGGGGTFTVVLGVMAFWVFGDLIIAIPLLLMRFAHREARKSRKHGAAPFAPAAKREGLVTRLFMR